MCNISTQTKQHLILSSTFRIINPTWCIDELCDNANSEKHAFLKTLKKFLEKTNIHNLYCKWHLESNFGLISKLINLNSKITDFELLSKKYDFLV